LRQAEVPCAPIQTIDQVFQSPQVLHRNMLVEVAHPTAGTVRMAGLPVKFSATPASVRLAPPLLGEHSQQVLSSWLGMSSETIAKLKHKGVI
jgi:crotonobetainyl-CoA:carnitine CoA-transferase CaiB-like acyl-CoA transferase